MSDKTKVSIEIASDDGTILGMDAKQMETELVKMMGDDYEVAHDIDFDVAEVGRQLRELEESCRTRLSIVKQATYDLIMTRFDMGKIIDEYLLTVSNVGEAVEALSPYIKSTILYQCRALYNHPQFRKSRIELMAWIEDQEVNSNRNVTWTMVRNFIYRKRPQTDSQVVNNKLEQLEAKANALGEELNSVLKSAEKITDASLKDEVLGVTTAVSDTLQQWEDVRDAEWRDKDRIVRSDEYLAFIRSIGVCSATGKRGDVHAHHVLSGVMGSKDSDLLAIPLAPEVHAEFHQIGINDFAMKYDVNPFEVIANCLHKYITGQWAYEGLYTKYE